MPDAPDLNTTCLSGELVRMPEFQQPSTFCEVKIRQRGGGILFLPLHVPTLPYLRLLEEVSPGDRLYAEGELAFVKVEGWAGGGQMCLKVKALRRLDAGGRVLPEAPHLAEDNPSGRPIAKPVPASTAVKRRRRRRRRHHDEKGGR